MSLFQFNRTITAEEAMQAVFAYQERAHRNWERAPEATRGAEPPAPNMSALQTTYGQMDPEEILVRFATNNRINQFAEQGNTLNREEASIYGRLIINIEKASEDGQDRPDVTVRGADGQDYRLEPKELSAWLQDTATDRRYAGQTIDAWVSARNIGLTGHPDRIMNGDNNPIIIETRDGQPRIVSNGVVTDPLDGYYGADASVRVGDGDFLDLYINERIYNQIQSGTPYRGSVFIMQQRGDDGELKIGFADSVDDFMRMQESYQGRVLNDFRRDLVGTIVEVPWDQYERLQREGRLDPDITLEEFVDRANLDMAAIERHPTRELELIAPNAEYIQSVQSALSTLGYLNLNGQAPSGVIDDPATTAAIRQLQSEQPGIGENGNLTHGVVQLLTRRIEEYNSRSRDTAAYDQTVNAERGTYAQMYNTVINNSDNAEVNGVLQRVGIADGDGKLSVEEAIRLQAFMMDPENISRVREIREQLDSVIEPSRDNFAEIPGSLERPNTPDAAAINNSVILR